MNVLHGNTDTGFWVATTGEVEKYLGYPAGHFGQGFMVGRWSGAKTDRTFPTLAEAVAAESTLPVSEPEAPAPCGIRPPGNSNALSEHLARLGSND
jgi:hypothetical protein